MGFFKEKDMTFVFAARKRQARAIWYSIFTNRHNLHVIPGSESYYVIDSCAKSIKKWILITSIYSIGFLFVGKHTRITFRVETYSSFCFPSNLISRRGVASGPYGPSFCGWSNGLLGLLHDLWQKDVRHAMPPGCISGMWNYIEGRLSN